MTSKQKNKIGAIALMAFCVGLVVWGLIDRKKLQENHVLGVGQVNWISSGGRGNGGRVYIDFIIQVNGKKYKGSSSYLDTDITPKGLGLMRGKTFPCIYHPSNPSISTLLILPKEFKKEGHNFPDSLNWLLPYLRKE